MPTYKDLLGMLRSAISRSVNIIAFNEGETNENGVHEDYIKIVRAVDGPLTTLDGNVQILELILDCCTDIIHFEDGSMIDQYRMDEEGFRKVREYFIEGVAVK